MSLYKYYAPDSFDFICVEGGVSARFSQPAILNDVFELKGAIDEENTTSFVKKVFDKFGIKTDHIEKEKFLELKKYINPSIEIELNEMDERTLNRSVGIFSVSDEEDHRAMWSYYSKDHTGFQIKFKAKSISSYINFESKDFIMAYDFVTYSNKRSIHFLPMLKNFSEEKNQADQLSIINEFFLCKDEHWSHEKEYRFICSLSEMKTKKIDSEGYGIFCKKIPASEIEAIRLGVRSSKALERKAKFWINTQSPSTKLYKLKPCNIDFRFEEMEIKL